MINSSNLSFEHEIIYQYFWEIDSKTNLPMYHSNRLKTIDTNYANDNIDIKGASLASDITRPPWRIITVRMFVLQAFGN